MRDKLNQPLTVEGKSSNKKKLTRGKMFGYQVLGFGAGGGGPQFVAATGGTITTSGNFKIHRFTGPGTFEVTAGSGDLAVVDYLVVAGGAGGGGSSLPNERGGGGGGAGGFRESAGACYTSSPLGACVAALPVGIQSYPITVGSGGAAGGGGPGTQPATKGTNGANSIFSTITSTGGGGGAIGGFPVPACKVTANTGGSGGGVGSTSGANRFGGAGNTPPVSPPQGQPGGGQRTCGDYLGGGGGGGATATGNVGQGGAPPFDGGPGGAGATTNITASPVTLAVGGRGGAWDGDNPNADGGANTGTGGSGGGANIGAGPNGNPGNTGGSGVVVIRYKFQ